MAWVELVAVGFVLLMVAWVFLRPFPKDNRSPEEKDKNSKDRN